MRHNTFFASSVDIVRPANANAYTANDIINEGTAKELVFKNVVLEPGRSFILQQAQIVSSFTPATALTAFVMLFDEPIIGPADHATFSPTRDQLSHCIGVLSLATQVKTAAGTITINATAQPLALRTTGAYTSIWAVVMALAAYTPGSAEYIKVLISGFEHP